MHFKTTDKKEIIPPFHINGQIIKPVTTAKYLGLPLDSKLTYSPQIQTIKEKA